MGTSSDRNETPAERLDRNWGELLQELRVTQTGVQLLTAFLLSLPLQQGFQSLADYQRDIYLVAVALSVAATGFLLAPVAVHRALFRHHEKDRLVFIGDRAARVGLLLLGLAVSSVVALIFSLVVSGIAGALASAVTVAMLVLVWWWLPHCVLRRHAMSGDQQPP